MADPDEEAANLKFAYLLKPVANLEKNFNVDVVKELKDYQESLKQLEEEAEMDLTKMNNQFSFAEAGVLVRAASSVYGRKVDYVHGVCNGFNSKLKETKQKKQNNEEDEGEEVGKKTRKRAKNGDNDDLFSFKSAVNLLAKTAKGSDFSFESCKAKMEKQISKEALKCFTEAGIATEPGTLNILPRELRPVPDNEKDSMGVVGLYHMRKEIIGKVEDYWITSPHVQMYERQWISDTVQHSFPTHGPRTGENGCGGCADQTCYWQGWFNNAVVNKCNKYAYTGKGGRMLKRKMRNHCDLTNILTLRPEMIELFEWTTTMALQPRNDLYIQNFAMVCNEREDMSRVMEFIYYKFGAVDRPLSQMTSSQEGTQGSFGSATGFRTMSDMELARRMSSLAVVNRTRLRSGSLLQMGPDMGHNDVSKGGGGPMDMNNPPDEWDDMNMDVDHGEEGHMDDQDYGILFDDAPEPFDIHNLPTMHHGVDVKPDVALLQGNLNGDVGVTDDVSPTKSQVMKRSISRIIGNGNSSPWDESRELIDEQDVLTVKRRDMFEVDPKLKTVPVKTVKHCVNSIRLRKRLLEKTSEYYTTAKSMNHRSLRLLEDGWEEETGVGLINTMRMVVPDIHEEENWNHLNNRWNDRLVHSFKRLQSKDKNGKWLNRTRTSNTITAAWLSTARDCVGLPLDPNEEILAGHGGTPTDTDSEAIPFDNDNNGMDMDGFNGDDEFYGGDEGGGGGRVVDMTDPDLGMDETLGMMGGDEDSRPPRMADLDPSVYGDMFRTVSRNALPSRMTGDRGRFTPENMDAVWANIEQKYQRKTEVARHFMEELNPFNEINNDLQKEIREWEDRLLPLLAEEEGRHHFDIHEIGGEILNQFTIEGEVKEFSEIVAGKEPYEVSRYFLSSLMMANTENLKLSDAHQRAEDQRTRGVTVPRCDGEESINTLELILKSRERPHEQDGEGL